MILFVFITLLAFVIRRLWLFVFGVIALWQLNEVTEGFRDPY